MKPSLNLFSWLTVSKKSFWPLVSPGRPQNVTYVTYLGKKNSLFNHFRHNTSQNIWDFCWKTPKLDRYHIRTFHNNSYISRPNGARLCMLITTHINLHNLQKTHKELPHTLRITLNICSGVIKISINKTTPIKQPPLSTHRNIQSPKSTGHNTWSSNLQAKPLVRLCFSLLYSDFLK